jgi:hypothetical protein
MLNMLIIFNIIQKYIYKKPERRGTTK